MPHDGPDLLTAYLSSHDARCAACGYNLRGLQTHACPECSAPLVLSVVTDEPLRRWRIPFALACLAIFITYAIDAALVIRTVGGIDFVTLADWAIALRVSSSFVLVVWSAAALFQLRQHWHDPQLGHSLRVKMWLLIALPILQLPQALLWLMQQFI